MRRSTSRVFEGSRVTDGRTCDGWQVPMVSQVFAPLATPSYRQLPSERRRERPACNDAQSQAEARRYLSMASFAFLRICTMINGVGKPVDSGADQSPPDLNRRLWPILPKVHGECQANRIKWGGKPVHHLGGAGCRGRPATRRDRYSSDLESSEL